jgi:hypothetical protein
LYILKINLCVKFLPSVTLVELAGLQENVLCVTKDLKAYRSLIYWQISVAVQYIIKWVHINTEFRREFLSIIAIRETGCSTERSVVFYQISFSHIQWDTLQDSCTMRTNSMIKNVITLQIECCTFFMQLSYICKI